jgi:PAS domain S-box-containing protein
LKIPPENCGFDSLTIDLLAVLPEPIFFTDSKFNIILINEQLLRLSGYKYSDLVGQPIETLWYCKDGVKLIDELSTRKQIDNFQIRLLTKAGDERNTLFSASAMSTINGRLLGFICVLHDITEVKRGERLTVIGETAHIVAHNLRNPLQGTRNAAYLLKKKYENTIDAQGIELLDIFNSNTIHVNEIINALLAFSEEFKPCLKKCSLKLIINSSLLRLQIPVNITINQRLDEAEFYLDYCGMQQVFTNIIKNAVEAMPNGGLIEISGYSNGRTLEIIVSDNGVGIPKELLAKLFKPLVTTKAQGLGFGLAICRQIIEAHGGTISLTSIEGRGTEVLIRLPYNIHQGNEGC